MTAPQPARSFVDPTTNRILISDFDVSEYLQWIQRRGVFGSHLLANFLHEWTHRWCFQSCVGSALALLRMRAACRTYRHESAADDYVRCMTASTILEPFAEGLALFAEFDTYPGKSRWLSQTLTASLSFFAPAVETHGNPFVLLEGLLQTLRSDPLLLERKAGVYARPSSEFDPYLVGYLSVRSLWCQMAAACPALNDRDLFLSYLRSFLYDDPGMVIRTLESQPTEQHASRSIVHHLLSRLRKLVSFSGLSERVEQWISSVEHGSLEVSSIGATEDDQRLATRMLDAALMEDFSAGEAVTAWMLMTLEERQICVVGSTPVQLKAQPMADRRDIIIKGVPEPLFSIGANVLPSASAGELTLVASSDARALVVFLSAEKDVAVVASYGGFSDTVLEIAKRHVANRSIDTLMYAEVSASLEKSTAMVVWEFVAERLKPAMKELFGPIVTLAAKESDWRNAFEELERKGVFGMLGHDGELTRALAMIGLVNTFSTDISIVRMMGKVLDVDEAALDRAMNLSSICGLPLAVRKSESVIALV